MNIDALFFSSVAGWLTVVINLLLFIGQRLYFNRTIRNLTRELDVANATLKGYLEIIKAFTDTQEKRCAHNDG